MKNKLLIFFNVLMAVLILLPMQALAYSGWDGYGKGEWEGDWYCEEPVVEEPVTGGGSNVLIGYIHLLSPNYGGEVLGVNGQGAGIQSASYNIVWESYSQGVDHVNILYSLDSGNSWQEIVAGYPNNGYYNWQLPQINNDHVLLRISAFAADGMNMGSDITNAPFTISNA